MLIASPPIKIDVIFAEGASGSYVRAIPDTTSDPNAASWTLGFPPNTFVDPGAGGEPPDGRDVNGVLNMLSAWTNWTNAGAPVFYDAAFSSSVGGYPKYAMLANASTVGQFWISQVDNNTSDPDTGGANWLAFPPSIGSYVSSFNGRSGAVVLSSTDVVNALAANALANAKLALMPAYTVKSNLTGSPAAPADNNLSALGLALFGTGVLGTQGYIEIPVAVAGSVVNFIFQWGQVSVVHSGPQAVTFPIAFPTLALGAVAQQNSDQNNGFACTSLSTTGMNVYAVAGGSSTYPGYYAAWGY